jgi:hypothetical protein
VGADADLAWGERGEGGGEGDRDQVLGGEVGFGDEVDLGLLVRHLDVFAQVELVTMSVLKVGEVC